MMSVERERQFRLLWSQGDNILEISDKMRMDHVRVIATAWRLGLDMDTAMVERSHRASLWRGRLYEARLHEELLKGCSID